MEVQARRLKKVRVARFRGLHSSQSEHSEGRSTAPLGGAERKKNGRETKVAPAIDPMSKTSHDEMTAALIATFPTASHSR